MKKDIIHQWNWSYGCIFERSIISLLIIVAALRGISISTVELGIRMDSMSAWAPQIGIDCNVHG